MSFRIRNILLIGIVLLILAWTIWPAMLVAVAASISASSSKPAAWRST